MALLYLARVALQAWHWLVDLSGLLVETLHEHLKASERRGFGLISWLIARAQTWLDAPGWLKAPPRIFPFPQLWRSSRERPGETRRSSFRMQHQREDYDVEGDSIGGEAMSVEEEPDLKSLVRLLYSQHDLREDSEFSPSGGMAIPGVVGRGKLCGRGSNGYMRTLKQLPSSRHRGLDYLLQHFTSVTVLCDDQQSFPPRCPWALGENVALLCNARHGGKAWRRTSELCEDELSTVCGFLPAAPEAYVVAVDGFAEPLILCCAARSGRAQERIAETRMLLREAIERRAAHRAGLGFTPNLNGHLLEWSGCGEVVFSQAAQ